VQCSGASTPRCVRSMPPCRRQWNIEGKALLTTEFRCFTNYPRLTQSHCSSTEHPSPVYPFSHRLSVSSFSLILPCREALQVCRPNVILPRARPSQLFLVHLPHAHHCIAPRHEKRSLVKDLSRTSTPFSGHYWSVRRTGVTRVAQSSVASPGVRSASTKNETGD